MKSIPFPRDLRSLARLCWGLVVLFLPVTSFKYFPLLGKDTMVRPLSFYPLAVLILILVIRLARKEITFRFNGSLLIYSLFLAVAMAASAWGVVENPITMHGQEYLGRMIRAWVTLIGGLVFFLASMLMNQDEQDIRFTLKWLYIGLAASVVWGAIQMISYYTQFPERSALNEIQTSFSIRKLLVKKRAAGFAYEPSWLANQLATIYLPWLIASLVSGYRVFKRRWIEPVLFAGAVGLLVSTFSRGGILMAIGSAGIVLLCTQASLFHVLLEWWRKPFQSQPGVGRNLSFIIGRLALLLGTIGIIGALGLSLVNHPYFSKLWKSNKTNLAEYMVDISAGPRLAYAMAGMGVYQDHPVLGVGLGGAGMYLYDQVPEWSKNLSEIAKHLTTNGYLYPNTKNMYVRLLAETGLFGFGFYVIFQLVVLGQMITLIRIRNRLVQYLSVAGFITWVTLVFFNFTQDSFLDPNGWFNLGVFLAIATGFLEQNGLPGDHQSPQNNHDMIEAVKSMIHTN